MITNIYCIAAFLVLLTIQQAYCYYPLFYLYTRTNPDAAAQINETNIKRYIIDHIKLI
jgi:hypothetical protein